MNKTIFTFILFIGLSLYAKKKVIPHLYEIKKGDQVGYLMGTIHVGISKNDLPEWFWNYFEKAEIIYFEYVNTPSFSKDSYFDDWFLRTRTKLQGYKIADKLTAKEFNNLDFYYGKLKNKKKYFDEDADLLTVAYKIERVILNEHLSSVNISTKSFDSLDNQLATYASGKQIKLSLDEKGDDYYNCVYETDPDKLITYIKANLSDLGVSKIKQIKKDKTLKKILNNYKNSKIEKEKKSNEPSLMNEDCIATGRNKMWLPKILKSLQSEKVVFVVVGVAHVNKENPNLLELLVKNGYTVRKVLN